MTTSGWFANNGEWDESDDPPTLVDTEVPLPLGWGDDHTAFIASLAREHALGWVLDDPRITQGAAA